MYCLGIRRNAATAEPAESAVATLTGPEHDQVVGAIKRKRKRRRSPGGLGRGLARILTDGQAHESASDPGPGLLRLVGGESAARTDDVRQSVVDIALRVTAEAFGLAGIVVTRRGEGPRGASPTGDGVVVDLPERAGRPIDPLAVRAELMASRLPDRWKPGTARGLELQALLERSLADRESADDHEATDEATDAADGPGPIRVTIAGHRVVVFRLDDGGRPVAAAVVRDVPFTGGELEALATVLGSVVAACSDSEAEISVRRVIAAGTTALLKSEGADVLAEVHADWPLELLGVEDGGRAASPTGRRTGVGRAADPVTAVARAAAKACRPRCEVTFAGASHVDDVEVSIAMVRRHDGQLRLGLAVRPLGDHTGVAEAVFTAAR